MPTLSYNDLLQLLTGIRDERATHANTATRIGEAFIMLLVYLVSADETLLQQVKEYVASHYLSKVSDDTAQGRITFQSTVDFADILKSHGAVNDFINGKGIFMDALAGLIQTEGLEVRGFMRVMELIINRLQLMESDYSFTEGGQVERVEPLGGGEYRLWMHKQHDNDVTPFCEGDIIYGKVNDLLSHGTYYTTWMRVMQDGVDTTDNTLTVQFYAGTDVGGGHNFFPNGMEVGVAAPSEAFDTMLNITRHGNWLYDVVSGQRVARYPDRQSAWVLSTTDRRLSFFWHVDKPIVEDYNYALCLGILPDLENLPTTRDRTMPSLYINTLFYEHHHVINYVTPPEYRVVHMGEWVQGMEARNGLVEYGDGTSAYITWQVGHLGLQWLCYTDHTTTEPHWRNPDWQCISAATPELKITATKRLLRNRDFANGRTASVLGFQLTLGGRDVSADVMQTEVVWTRQTPGADDDPVLAQLDTAWNQRHRLGNLTLPISSEDLPTNWYTEKSVQFTCTVNVAGISSMSRTLTLH